MVLHEDISIAIKNLGTTSEKAVENVTGGKLKIVRIYLAWFAEGRLPVGKPQTNTASLSCIAQRQLIVG